MFHFAKLYSSNLFLQDVEIADDDFHSCMADRNEWFGIMQVCGNLSFVTGDILCFPSHALIALYS